MKPPVEAVRTVGDGPDLVLIHGTASDGSSWTPLTRLLRERVRVTTYDRRGTSKWPIAEDAGPPSTEDHAVDVAEIILGLGAGPVHVCGVSYGGVVALELIRLHPELVRGAVLFEPAIAADDRLPSVPTALLAEFERLLGDGKPAQAAEYFHRRVMSDAVWESLPMEAKEQARSLWKQIHGDLRANRAHRVRYHELGDIEVPVLLLRGGRSHQKFGASLRALRTALPRSRLEIIARAGHQIHGQAWRELGAALTDFMGA